MHPSQLPELPDEKPGLYYVIGRLSVLFTVGKL
jgi:hypothetical protein